jgi:hypothetical protein
LIIRINPKLHTPMYFLPQLFILRLFFVRHCNCADIDRHLSWRKQNYLLVWMDGTILLQMCICGYMNAYASSDGLWPVCLCVIHCSTLCSKLCSLLVTVSYLGDIVCALTRTIFFQNSLIVDIAC